MSEKLDSILNRELAWSGRAFDNARTSYRTVRNGLMGLGLSTAIFLPLAGSEPPPPPTLPPATQPPPIHNEVHYHTNGGATAPVVPPAEAPTVHVDLVTYDIQFAPPMTRDWHRTRFSRDGDEFWALPDASFIMRFKRADGWDDACLQEACNGTFSFQSERYLGADVVVDPAWTVQGREITRTNLSGFDGVSCRTISPPDAQPRTTLTPIEHCMFVASDRSPEVMRETLNQPDLCIWMRRSEHLEQGRETGTVALDVRWTRLDHQQSECPRIYGDGP